MKIVHNARPRIAGMTRAAVMSVALTLYGTNRTALIITKGDPFLYLRLLKEYGVQAKAIPIRRDQRLIGYKFKNVS